MMTVTSQSKATMHIEGRACHPTMAKRRANRPGNPGMVAIRDHPSIRDHRSDLRRCAILAFPQVRAVFLSVKGRQDPGVRRVCPRNLKWPPKATQSHLKAEDSGWVR